jgi:hypothetical protein
MIKFFRKIRQNLLMENKTGKYFKYAIGEIVLVVIGILIALSVNSWNEKRLKKVATKNYLKQIKSELVLDVEFLNDELKTSQNSINYLNLISEGKYDSIDLSLLLYSLSQNLSHRNFGASYNKLLETGNTEYINDDELSKNLQSYYFVTCSSYNEVADFHQKFTSDNIEGPLLLMLNHKKNFLVDSLEVIQALENEKLLSLVNWQVSFLEYSKPKIEKNINAANKLIDLINRE